jgi:hypothetical protein
MEKKIIPVETDSQKLVSYVCGSNLFKEGDDIKLKPDEEYPDWLWTLRTGENITFFIKVASGYRLVDQALIPGRKEIFLFTTASSLVWNHPVSYTVGT